MTSSPLKGPLPLIPHWPFAFCRAASRTFPKTEATDPISTHLKNTRPSITSQQMSGEVCRICAAVWTGHVLKMWSTGWCYWEVVFYWVMTLKDVVGPEE